MIILKIPLFTSDTMLNKKLFAHTYQNLTHVWGNNTPKYRTGFAQSLYEAIYTLMEKDDWLTKTDRSWNTKRKGEWKRFFIAGPERGSDYSRTFNNALSKYTGESILENLPDRLVNSLKYYCFRLDNDKFVLNPVAESNIDIFFKDYEPNINNEDSDTI